ncbi:hypothetical protein EW145_g6974 [Phellinidium pouzarii]|uniref:Uncharacterized protein n=1 Tax=Phellinidium pouzarii TaxID=167371 RepID=A0A4S4KR58_9AGAM|nr:hypothetical protein EW145_g6974 [Phellinidium pouzarii]
MQPGAPPQPGVQMPMSYQPGAPAQGSAEGQPPQPGQIYHTGVHPMMGGNAYYPPGMGGGWVTAPAHGGPPAAAYRR